VYKRQSAKNGAHVVEKFTGFPWLMALDTLRPRKCPWHVKAIEKKQQFNHPHWFTESYVYTGTSYA